MRKDEIENHLSFWRAWQESEPTASKVFRFKMCCTGRTSGELEPARYERSTKKAEGKKKRKRILAGGKAPTAGALADIPTPVPSSVGPLGDLPRFPTESGHLADGGRHNVDNVNMQRDTDQDSDRIPPCGLSLPPDMQPGYSGQDQVLEDLDFDLDPELASLLPPSLNLNDSSSFPGEYNMYNTNNAFGLDDLSGGMGMNPGNDILGNPAGQHQPSSMSPALAIGIDRTGGTYMFPISTGGQALHTLGASMPTLPISNAGMERDAGERDAMILPSVTGMENANGMISGSKRKAADTLEDRPLQKRRGQSANQSAHGAPAEPRAAAANDGILTSGGPNREKRVSARVAKKVADDAAKNAKAATRNKARHSGRR